MKGFIAALLLTLTTPVWGEVIIDVASTTQVSGTAIITAYRVDANGSPILRPDGSLDTDAKVHYKIVSTNQGKVFDSYLLEGKYGVGFIWIIDPKFNADLLVYASNTDTTDVAVYVEWLTGNGGVNDQIFTEARNLRPRTRSVYSSAMYVCPQNNPLAKNARPC